MASVTSAAGDPLNMNSAATSVEAATAGASTPLVAKNPLDLNTDAAPPDSSAAVEASGDEPAKRTRGRPRKYAFSSPAPAKALPPPESKPVIVAVPAPTFSPAADKPGWFPPFQAEAEGVFYPGQLVWGKVRSHPWWPGQVFDASAASEMAEHARRRAGGKTYLVAYFDNTFAWNDEAAMKPFCRTFSRMARQSSTGELAIALDAALNEVSSRIERAMVCRCNRNGAPEAPMVVNNAGLKKGIAAPESDRSFIVNSFDPKKLLEAIHDLACNVQNGKFNKLDLTIIRALVRAFDQFRAYRCPVVFFDGAEVDNALLESPIPVIEASVDEKPQLRKVKVPASASIGDSDLDWDPHYKSSDHDDSEYSDGKKNKKAASRKKRRVHKVKEEPLNAVQYPAVHDMLLQLRTAAVGFVEDQGFPQATLGFFSKFRNSVTPKSIDDLELLAAFSSKKGRRGSVGQKAMISNAATTNSEGDSYWSDLVINGSGTTPASGGVSGKTAAKSKRGRKRKTSAISPEPQVPLASTQPIFPAALPFIPPDSTPAALILFFSSSEAVPSESDLANILRPYGPLIEEGTVVTRRSSSAKVLFKNRADAEVAFTSTGKYGMFGPTLVRCELSYFATQQAVVPMAQGNAETNLPPQVVPGSEVQGTPAAAAPATWTKGGKAGTSKGKC